jgi:CRISPR-associated protein Cas2
MNSSCDKNWYLVAYDIRNPKRLNRVCRKLKGYGVRLQFSVFRCRLTDKEKENLVFDLTKIIQKEDNLFITILCDNCVKKIQKLNSKINWESKLPTYSIV